MEQGKVSEKFVSSVPPYVEIDGCPLRVVGSKLIGHSKSGPIPVNLPKKPSKIPVGAKHDVPTVDGPAYSRERLFVKLKDSRERTGELSVALRAQFFRPRAILLPENSWQKCRSIYLRPNP